MGKLKPHSQPLQAEATQDQNYQRKWGSGMIGNVVGILRVAVLQPHRPVTVLRVNSQQMAHSEAQHHAFGFLAAAEAEKQQQF